MSGDGLSVGRWFIPEAELEERFDTPGGPGGQHANRNRTAVTIRLDVDSSSLPDNVKRRLRETLGATVEAVASQSRSQWRNRALARKQLAQMIETALVEPKTRRATKPSRSSREKRLRDKRARAKIKRERRKPGADDL